MAYPKLLSSGEILKTAVHLVEHGDADGLSLRAVAAKLGVKAPSLYRYFPDKGALEVAVAEEILTIMLGEFRTASATADTAKMFRRMTDAYLRFARERFPLYAFVMQNRHPERYGAGAGKAVWNLLLEAASGVSGQPDDTAAAVATWAFLHGYATLEHSGAFGPSGPKGGLERGVEAFLSNFRSRARSVRKERTARADVPQRRKKP
ncbi:TetR/AcrR family transcriptional regulator [Tunturiibacter gelidoferens]|uniref:AcrR family transcriptional regulator n=1 Tax=Tunturiibacter gelidiferens TaxID=3069689 RepID=A0A9X0U3X9_9BACT|nr:TetR/AcrR family transcriptional regulator [Edaphobacter lichenicola]MBB5328824.1 AcrR family transcriptional regulator [Edaphobacter lichenicola]